MNKKLYKIGGILALASTLCYGDWISPVDKKYAEINPAVYTQVAKAKTLISEAKGRTDLNIQAVDLLQAVLTKDPKFAPAYVQMARVTSNLGYQVNNRFDGTALQSQEDYLTKALELEKNYDYALALMGYTKMFQGKLDQAEKYYEQAQKLGSKYPFLKAQLAQLASKRGNYSKAIQLATEGFEENLDDPKIAAGIITELIFAYERLDGDHNNELEVWQAKRRTLDPNAAWYWGDHARFRLYFLGDYENTIKYAQKALSIMDYGVGRYILAAAYYKKWADLKADKSRKEEANEAWKNGQQLVPDTSEMAQKLMRNPRLKSTAEALLEKASSNE